MSGPLLAVRDLKVQFPVLGQGLLFRPTRWLKAVDEVGFDLDRGETLGVVGESGCGKSTLARGILGLVPPRSGSVRLQGRELVGLSPRALRPQRRHMQMIFQDPLASLDPRLTVGQIIAEPLQTFEPQLAAAERRQRVRRVMDRVGLLPSQINRCPHEFSGGQCQRIGIARALVVEPEVLLCDEPVSALDVSIQAQVVNLLMDLQAELGISLLFIAHDLSVVEHISHRVMVMYLGRVAELAPADEIYARPRHPYTHGLIQSVPIPDPAIERAKPGVSLKGDVPSPLDPPGGCSFRTRCPRAAERCARERPPLEEVAPGHLVACHFPESPA